MLLAHTRLVELMSHTLSVWLLLSISDDAIVSIPDCKIVMSKIFHPAPTILFPLCEPQLCTLELKSPVKITFLSHGCNGHKIYVLKGRKYLCLSTYDNSTKLCNPPVTTTLLQPTHCPHCTALL